MRALLRLLTITAVAVLFVSCEMVQDLLGTSSDDASGGGSDPNDATFSSSLYRLEGVYEGVSTVTADLGASPRDVYYVFSNLSGSRVNVGDAITESYVLWGPNDRVQAIGQHFSPSAFPESRYTPAIRGLPPGRSQVVPQTVRESVGSDAVGASSVAWRALSSYSVGSTERLYTNLDGSKFVEATVRALSSDGTREVYIWVDDVIYNSEGLIDAAYEALADRFLKSGNDNDIYDWVTTIFGAPWGIHDSPVSLIPSESDDIHILLYDIEEGYAGYFWSKDNVASTYYGGSNERLMFYIDHTFFAAQDGPTWDISDSGPADMVSTLAHEFQHMINFYQREILRDPDNYFRVDTWINEMSSMVAEDLVADKLAIAGPADGRLGSYIIGAAEYRVTDRYPDGSNINVIVTYYALYYSFGAYLSRTYGSQLFTEIARQPIAAPAENIDGSSNGNGEIALRSAIEAVTGEAAPTLDELIRRWAIAMFVSDDPTATVPFSINESDGFISSQTNGTTYNLESIDLHGYWNDFSAAGFSYRGPLIFVYDQALVGLSDRGNAFFLARERGSNLFQEAVDIPDGVTLTVLSRESQ